MFHEWHWPGSDGGVFLQQIIITRRKGNKTIGRVFREDKVNESSLTLTPRLPHFVGIAVVSFAPYATFLFSWDYAIIIADKSCLLPWLQIDARGALKLAFPLQKSSFHASCSGFNPPHPPTATTTALSRPTTPFC